MGAVVIPPTSASSTGITPDYVHVFVDGGIGEKGGPEWQQARGGSNEAFLPAPVGGEVVAVTESEIVKGIGSDYEVKDSAHVPEDYFFKSGQGLSHELVDAISSHG